MKINFLLIAAITVLFFACDDEDIKSKGEYETGVLIANEGGFGKNTASITHYNSATEEVEQNIFVKAPLAFAGDVLQSISFSGDNAYLILNGSNKVEIANAFSFESTATFIDEDLVSPRYLEVINNKAYISVWGPYDENFSLIDSYVMVVNLADNSVITKIDTDEGCENMRVANNKLFVSNYNYGSSNTIAVINPVSNTIIDQVEVGAGPADMVVDKNGKLWVLCTGSWTGDPAKLVRINTSSLALEEEIELSVSPSTDLAITADGSTLLYRDDADIYSLDIAATTEPANVLFTAEDVLYPYALNIDPATGDIWIGDALSFASDGKAYVYSSTGVFKKTIDVGVGPTQFIFR